MEPTAEPNSSSSSSPQSANPESISYPTSTSHHDLLPKLQSLHESFQTLQEKSTAWEEKLTLLQRQNDDFSRKDSNFRVVIDELTKERDLLGERVNGVQDLFREREDEYLRKFEEELREREGLRIEVEVYREKYETFDREREKKSGLLVRIFDLIRVVKEGLVRVIESVEEEKEVEREENGDVDMDLDQESRLVWEEIIEARRLVDMAESKVNEYKEVKKKERRQLENSVVSLTEENRDISNLLRVALVEKEAVEKSLNKLRGNNEQKRVPLLQRVGFGFMMGGGNAEQLQPQPQLQPVESSAASTASTGSKSDGSECEEEVVSLVC